MTHELQIPFSGWWLVTVGAVIVISIAIVIRCHRLLAKMTVFSLFLAVLMLIAMPATPRTAYATEIIWSTGTADEAGRVSHFAVMLDHGRASIWLNVTKGFINDWPITATKFLWRSFSTPNNGHYPLWNDRFSLTKSDFIQKTLGFQLCWWTGPDPVGGPAVGMYSITLPQWSILLLCPWFPLIWFRRHRCHRFRVKNGLCLKCGFDLRAHKPGDKCPECGTTVPTPAIPPAATATPSAQLPPA